MMWLMWIPSIIYSHLSAGVLEGVRGFNLYGIALLLFLQGTYMYIRASALCHLV